MANLLIISNGHGEDLSGSLLAVELRKKGHKVHAFPLVGIGRAYSKLGLKVLGLKREFSTGGIGYTSILGRLTELIQGQFCYLIRSICNLLTISSNYDLLIVVGDVVPVFAAFITNRKWVVYLVAYSSYYEGRLRLPWPSSLCLRSYNCLKIYSRDQLTAEDLSYQLNRLVHFLGNPFMDSVLTIKEQLPKKSFRLGLLPGSRRPELDNNILRMLRVLKCLPEKIYYQNNISFDMALVDVFFDKDLFDLLNKEGWYLKNNDKDDQIIKVCNGTCLLNIHRNSFAAVLQSSDMLLCSAGTAVEQAIGLGKPVVQLPGNGPQFTSSFAEAQRRLLGETVFCAENNSQERTNIFVQTANLILTLYHNLNNDFEFNQLCASQASARLGNKGGTKLIVKSIHQILEIKD